jgi:preprotein translocase subunit SecG
MVYGLLLTLYVIMALLLILLILIQKGKGSMGIGNLGGGTQMLFGGSGGQDLFQKITWALGALLMLGSLALALLKASSSQTSRYVTQAPVAQVTSVPTAPASPPVAEQPEQPEQQAVQH